jgi:hypothetical protein
MGLLFALMYKRIISWILWQKIMLNRCESNSLTNREEKNKTLTLPQQRILPTLSLGVW